MKPAELIGWVAAIAAALSTFLEVSKIEINPWSWLAKKIGRAINGEVIAKVDKLEKEVCNIQNGMDERAAKDARVRILRFGDEVLHGAEHSKEHFDQILLDITEYENYCDEHKDFKR